MAVSRPWQDKMDYLTKAPKRRTTLRIQQGPRNHWSDAVLCPSEYQTAYKKYYGDLRRLAETQKHKMKQSYKMEVMLTLKRKLPFLFRKTSSVFFTSQTKKNISSGP